MFSGIIRHQGRIRSLKKLMESSVVCLGVAPEFLEGLEVGSSVAVNGICLTATHINPKASEISFDLILETLKKTTAGDFFVGQTVHVERALKWGDELGGHVLSGHVSGVAQVCEVTVGLCHVALRLYVAPELQEYIMPKGSVALHGVSLTVMEGPDDGGFFSVHLIPETQRNTILGVVKQGALLNIEVDSTIQAVVRTTKALMASQPGGELYAGKGIFR